MVGDTIKYIRETLDMSQREFATKVKISQPSIVGYEQNKRVPSFDVIQRIYKYARARKVKISLSRFFEEKDVNNGQ